MSEKLVRLITGAAATAIIAATTFVVLGGIWTSSLAPEPGDPFYDSMVATTEGAVAAFALLSVAGIIGIFAWMAGHAQSL